MSTTAIILYIFLFGIGAPLLMITVDVALANTLLIFIIVTGLGLWLCRRTRVKLSDNKLKILEVLWIIKLILTLFLLIFGWMPNLDPTSDNWGYDPQRYYQDAYQLIVDDWNPIVDSNYQGIIFYYGFIFYLFGHNPVIPALINSLITLLGTLYLIRCAYSFLPVRTAKDWTIASLLIVPEVLWYDALTARETMVAVLIVFGTLSVGSFLAGVKNVSLKKTVLILGVALFAIFAIRTSMAIPVVVSACVMAVMFRSKNKNNLFIKQFLIGIMLIMLLIGPSVQQFIGGYNMDWVNTFNTLQSYERNVASLPINEWSDKSIGKLIAPNNTFQAAIYLPIRMVLYLAAPFPNVAVSVPELIKGSWGAWQSLMTILTSVMTILGFPFVLASAKRAWHFRLIQPAPLVLHISFWVTFMAIAGGNIIIHERYRVMFTLLLFSCMWLGYIQCTSHELKIWGLSWYCLLAAGALFYYSFKFI